MVLSKWIDQSGGTRAVATKLGVSDARVCHWKQYRCLPDAKRMRAIVKMSRGKVTYKSMIEGFLKVKGE